MKTNPAMTKADLEAAIAKTTSVFAEKQPDGRQQAPGQRATSRARSSRCATTTGSPLEYRFDEVQKLRWRREGETAWHEERYESWESAPGVDHVRPLDERRAGPRRVLDRRWTSITALVNVPARHDGHAVHGERGGREDARSA